MPDNITRVVLLAITSHGGEVLLSACLCVCLFVCPLAYLKNHTPKFHQMFCRCHLWPWLGPPLTAMWYVTYFRFSDDVMFSYNGGNGPQSKTTRTFRPVRLVAAPVCRLPTASSLILPSNTYKLFWCWMWIGFCCWQADVAQFISGRALSSASMQFQRSTPSLIWPYSVSTDVETHMTARKCTLDLLVQCVMSYM